MGVKGSKLGDGSALLDDPMTQTKRVNLSAWHREGVSVWDVYELVEVIGEGHMGEVYKVRRKKERRGTHNSATRRIEREKSTLLDERGVSPHRERSKSPFQERRRGSLPGELKKVEEGLKKMEKGLKKPLKKPIKTLKKTMSIGNVKGIGDKSGGGGSGTKKEKTIRPEPAVVGTKEPQAPSDTTPRRSILKESRFSRGSSGDLPELEATAGAEADGSPSEDDGGAAGGVASSSSGSGAPASSRPRAHSPPPPPLFEGGDGDDDDDDDDEEMDNAAYMEQWKKKLEGAKEERAKMLEKINSQQKMDTLDKEKGEGGEGTGTPPPPPSPPESSAAAKVAALSAAEVSKAAASNSNDSAPFWPGRVTPRDGDAPITPRSAKKKIRFQRMYACKTVLTSHVKKGFLAQLLNEISIMKNLDHPYILQLYEVYQVKRSIWLVTELCTGGDLSSRKPNEPQTTVVVEQILRALTYLHRHGICHRDIKLENILYEHGGKEATIRLIDFGLSQAFDRASDIKRKAIGTAYTLSPEMASGDGEYTMKTDIWALGVVAWLLLAGDAPFLKTAAELEDKEKKNRLLNADFRFGITWQGRGITEYGKDFVRGCLKKNPKDRWSAKEALDFVQETWIPGLEGEKKDDKEASQQLGQTIVFKRKNSFTEKEISLVDVNRFVNYGRLKKTILMTMARSVERDEVDKLREIFLTADTEDTGTISLIELKNALKQLNSTLADEEVETIFEGIDQDRSGQIHWAEFIAALSESHGLVTMDRLAAVFDRLDTEGKGYISHENLKVILGTDYNKEIVDSMIREADFKNNGQIDYDEFLQLMFSDPEAGDLAVGRVHDDDETFGSLKR